MAVRVDQAGNQRPALAVEPVAGPLGPLVAALVEPLRPCRRRRPASPVKRISLPVGVERVAVDIVDQHVGERRAGRSKQGSERRQQRRRSGGRPRLHRCASGAWRIRPVSPAAPDGLGGRHLWPPAHRIDRSTQLPVTLADVEAAAARIEGAVVRTPTLLSQTLSELTGAKVYLKFENLQFTAAYKERGALNTLLLLDEATRARGRDRGVGRQSCAGPRLSRHAGSAFRSRS